MNSFYKGGSELPTGKGSSCSNQIKSKKLWPLVFKLVVLFRLYFNSIPPVRIKHSLSTDIVLITQNLRKKIRQGKTYFKDTSVLLKNRCKISAQNQIKTAGSSSSLRVLFEDPSTLRRTNVASSSGMLRLLFDCASGRSRGVAEALPKPSQRAPEPVSTMSQRSLEAEPKVSRRGEEVSPSSVFCLTNFAQASAFHAVCLEFSSGSHRVAPIKTRCRPDEKPMKCKNSVGIAQKMVDYSLAQETHKLDYSATLGSPLLSPCYTQGQLNDCTSPTQQKEAFQEGGESRLTYGVESEQSVLRCFKPTCKAFVFRVNTLLGSIDPVVQRALKYFLFLANYELTYRMVLACIHLWIVFQSSNFSFKALKNKQALFILVCLFHMFSLSAQTPRKDSGADWPNKIKALKVGDTVPDLLLKTSLKIFDKTGAESNIVLDDFKERVIIIDLWGTWCTYCINSFPHLFHLQNKFQEKIKVLPVVNQSRERVLTSLNKSPIKNITGFVTAIDSTLGDYFPTLGFPHVIVIADRRVVSITLPEYLTEEAIANLIIYHEPYIPIKKDDAIIDNSTLLSSSLKDVRQYRPIVYRTILGFQDGLISNVLLKRDTAITRWLIPNMDIMSLFEIAYFDYNKKSDDFVGLANFPNRRIILTPELTALLLPKPLGTYPREARLDVQRKYYYTYENLAAHSISDEKLKIQLAEDLDNFLNVKSRLLMVPMECYVIARKSNLSSDFEENIDKNTFLRYLNHPTFKLPPVLLGKNLENLPKMSLEEHPHSFEEIKRVCEAHGLEVHSQINLIPMLVFYKDALPDTSNLGKFELGSYGYMPVIEKYGIH